MSRALTITELLERVQTGDADAMNHLYSQVRPALEAIIRQFVKRQIPEGGLETTGLIDLVLERLLKEDTTWRSKTKFYGYARNRVRGFVADALRRHAARGGRVHRVPVSDDLPDDAERPPEGAEREEFRRGMQRALADLRQQNEHTADVFRLRTEGRTYKEIAEELGLGETTVKDKYAVAMAYLSNKLRAYGDADT